MSYDYGPLDTYEVVWTSGHIERIQGHQVLWPQPTGIFGQESPQRQHVMIHGQFDGRWKLVLSALPTDLVIVRLVTADEPMPASPD